jgi:hypothetical protein
MSYDLHLFRPPAGADLREAGRHSFQYEGDGPATEASEARKRALADVLLAFDPQGLRELPPDDPPRESPIPPPLELYADEPHIRIFIFDLTAAMELPFSRDDGVWEKARGYLRVLEQAGGFRTYDPQGYDILDPAEPSSAEPGAAYDRGLAIIDRIHAQSDPHPDA